MVLCGYCESREAEYKCGWDGCLYCFICASYQEYGCLECEPELIKI